MNIKFTGELRKLEVGTRVDPRNMYEGITYGKVAKAYLETFKENKKFKLLTINK